MSCPYEMLAKRGAYKGTQVCVLSGVPCLINDPKDRPGCDRLEQVKRWTLECQRHVKDGLGQIIEVTEQGKPL